MSLIACPECGRQISEKALCCPGCGCPATEFQSNNQKSGNWNIVCPECGHENESNTQCCIFCGYEYDNDECEVKPRLLAKEDQEELFNCYKCGRPLPIGIDQCVYCKYKYGTFRGTNAKMQKKIEENNAFVNNWRISKERKEDKKAREKTMKTVKRDRSNNSNNDYVKCPKCGSSSISYDTKKLSIGRTLIGDVIAGAPGAILGGVSSKKGFAVCLNCGKRWKI